MCNYLPGCGDSSGRKNTRWRGSGGFPPDGWAAETLDSPSFTQNQGKGLRRCHSTCLPIRITRGTWKTPASSSPHWRFWLPRSGMGTQKSIVFKSPAGDSQRCLVGLRKPCLGPDSHLLQKSWEYLHPWSSSLYLTSLQMGISLPSLAVGIALMKELTLMGRHNSPPRDFHLQILACPQTLPKWEMAFPCSVWQPLPYLPICLTSLTLHSSWIGWLVVSGFFIFLVTLLQKGSR